MFSAKKSLLFLAVLGTSMFLAAPAVADWDEGDGHKMHFPQLPDPDGWDVAWPTSGLFGDDWQCSETGPVSDIHFWVSFKEWDLLEVPEAMAGVPVSVQIWSDQPADGAAFPYSRPNGLLREWTFDPGDYTIRHYDTGDQGWYWPETGGFLEHDHTQYFQINIDKITDPFIQEEGKIYWLVTDVEVPGDNQIGWKTTKTQFMDAAVFYSDGWQKLYDPLTGASLDLAFVITPEPGTLVLLAMAGLGLLLFAWRRRK